MYIPKFWFFKHWQHVWIRHKMPLDLSSGKLRPESLPHHLVDHGTDPSVGNSSGAAALKINGEVMSYSSKSPTAHPNPCSSPKAVIRKKPCSILLTWLRNPSFLGDMKNARLENQGSLLLSLPELFQSWILPRFYWPWTKTYAGGGTGSL